MPLRTIKKIFPKKRETKKLAKAKPAERKPAKVPSLNSQIGARIQGLFAGKSSFAVSKGDRRILSVTPRTIVVSLGSFIDRQGQELFIAMKGLVGRKTLHTIIFMGDLKTEKQRKIEERIYRTAKHLGIPTLRFFDVFVVRPEAKKRGGPSFWFPRPTPMRAPECVVSVAEDLSRGGKLPVKEFYGFDFAQVSNGSELMKEFERHYATLVEAGVKISPRHSHHMGDVPLSLKEECEKSFFVVPNPRTRKGRIVFGDLDQIQFS